MALFLLLFSSALLTLRANAQAGSDSHTNSQPKCTDPPCNYGGGGGGGTVPPNPSLTWGSPLADTSLQIGPGPDNYGVATAQNGPDTYMAYQNLNVPGQLFVWSSTNTNGYYGWGPTQTFPNAINQNTPVALSSGPQQVYSASSPAIAFAYPPNQGRRLYVGYIDNNGGPTFVSTTDGTHYGDGGSLRFCGNSGTATFSPSMVVFQGVLYMFYAQAATHQLTVCRINSDGSVQTTIVNGRTIGSSPSATVYNGAIYVGFKADDPTNYLYLYTSTDGVNYTLNSGPNGSHSSTAPSLAVRNNILYMGFRQNDPQSHAFFYNYSTDGNNFSSPILVNWSVGGPPSLVVNNQNPQQICNLFRQNDTSSYLYASCAN